MTFYFFEKSIALEPVANKLVTLNYIQKLKNDFAKDQKKSSLEALSNILGITYLSI